MRDMASSGDGSGVQFCPFSCGYKTENDYQIMMVHIQVEHAEPDEMMDARENGNQNIDPALLAHDHQPSRCGERVADDGPSGRAMIEGLRPSREGEDDTRYAYCPVEGCGESILLAEIEEHVEMHGEERGFTSDYSNTPDGFGQDPTRGALGPASINGGISDGFDTKLDHALRNLGRRHDDYPEDYERGNRRGEAKKQNDARSAWGRILNMPESPRKSNGTQLPNSKRKRKGRLGKSELGPHAHEKQMPASIVEILKKDGAMQIRNAIGPDGRIQRVQYCPNMAVGIIPVLEKLLAEDEEVRFAYLCDERVKHISKLAKEGGFCGYRNIQMACSYIVEAQIDGHQVLDGKIPTIFNIQDAIEAAWDLGYNPEGRIETGGIRGTRKYIGTPDAQAMFNSLAIFCEASAFKSSQSPTKVAYDVLLSWVEAYFTSSHPNYEAKIRRTSLPPIYFQHPGHSMTIVGFERLADGSRQLLVFDPMFHDSQPILDYAAQLENEKVDGHERQGDAESSINGSTNGSGRGKGGRGKGTRTRGRQKTGGELLKAYRRGVRYLKKYKEFEVLTLVPQEFSVRNDLL